MSIKGIDNSEYYQDPYSALANGVLQTGVGVVLSTVMVYRSNNGQRSPYEYFNNFFQNLVAGSLNGIVSYANPGSYLMGDRYPLLAPFINIFVTRSLIATFRAVMENGWKQKVEAKKLLKAAGKEVVKSFVTVATEQVGSKLYESTPLRSVFQIGNYDSVLIAAARGVLQGTPIGILQSTSEKVLENCLESEEWDKDLLVAIALGSFAGCMGGGFSKIQQWHQKKRLINQCMQFVEQRDAYEKEAEVFFRKRDEFEQRLEELTVKDENGTYNVDSAIKLFEKLLQLKEERESLSARNPILIERGQSLGLALKNFQIMIQKSNSYASLTRSLVLDQDDIDALKQIVQPELDPITQIDFDRSELINHVVLVHALKLPKDLSCFQFAVTADGIIGNHLDFETQEFQSAVVDRPHTHWFWNQLVQPNSGGNWEDAPFAVLEPLSQFENTDQKPFAVTPYDTLMIRAYQLSAESIILVPDSMFEEINGYINETKGFKGKVISYPDEQTLRSAIYSTLKDNYPHVWHACDEKGNLTANKTESTTSALYDFTNGYYHKTCLKVDENHIIVLLENENNLISYSLQEFSNARRFIGLHHNSITDLLESKNSAYRDALRVFTADKKKKIKLEDQIFFAASCIDRNGIDLNNLGVLIMFNIYQKLMKEQDPETGAQRLANYWLNEAMCADLASLFYHYAEEDAEFNLSTLDLKLIFEQHPVREHLIELLENISLDPTKANVLNYCKQLQTYLDCIQQAKEETKILDSVREEEETFDSPFMGAEWDPPTDDLEFDLTKPLSSKLYKYSYKVLEALEGRNLEQLYHQLHHISNRENTKEEQYKLNIIRSLTRFAYQQKAYRILLERNTLSVNERFIISTENEEQFNSVVTQGKEDKGKEKEEANNEENATVLISHNSTVTSSEVVDDNWHLKVLNKLSNHEISAKEIIDILSENFMIKEFYVKPAGITEGYTVGQHTEMVLELAQRYRTYFEPEIHAYIDWGDFLLFLALHDIGKGASNEIVLHTVTTAKELELEANRMVLTRVLEQLRVSSRIGHIFQALLMYDSQGDYLKGKIDAECLKGHLLDMAAVSLLAPDAFYRIYTTFHLIDAASYPNLRPLFIFGEETLQHCEGNNSLIGYLYHILEH